MKKNEIKTLKVDGEEKEIKVLYAFDSLEVEKRFVIYTDDLEADEMKYVAFMDEEGNFINTTDEEDMKIIDAYLREDLKEINDNVEL